MDTYIKTKILIICPGNTCRSQMAEGFLKSLNPWLEVYSAGTKAEQHVNPYAVRAMMEMGINIGYQKPKSVDIFLDQAFDYVITVCDGAKEICPFFSGKVISTSAKSGVFCSMNNRAFRALSASCLLYTSPSPRDRQKSRMPSSA